MEWLRLYHGTTSDPKWPIIAKRSGQPQGTVVAVWVALLEYASQQDDRGSIEGFDAEGLDVLLGYEDGTTEAVMREMHDPKRGVLADGRIAAWESRQPKREDGSAERAKAWRDKKKETPNASERERTHPNADEQNRTQKNTDQNRTEQNREEEKESSLHPEAVQLAARLIDRIHETNPKAKAGNAQTWAKHTDRMLRLDGRTVEEVEAVIDWCQRDSFWCSNILSTKKLREKFDQLTAQMNRKLRVVNDRPDKFAGAI